MALISLTAEAVTWSNVEVNLGVLGPLSLPTIKKIEYGSKVNPVAVYGAGNKMYDRTDGIIDVDPIKTEIGVSDWAVLFQTLVTYGALQPGNIANGLIFNGTNGMDIVLSKYCSFPMSVSYQLLGQVVVLTDVLSNCRITSIGMAPAQGPEPVMVALELQCTDVQRSIL